MSDCMVFGGFGQVAILFFILRILIWRSSEAHAYLTHANVHAQKYWRTSIWLYA